MGLHDVVNEAEANSRASDFSVAVAAVEALEDFGAVGFGDAGASVGDNELSSRWNGGGGEGNGAGGGGELDGVVEEVDEELPNGEGIESWGVACGEVEVGGEGVLFLFEVGLDELEGFGEEGLQIGGLEVIELVPFLDAGEIEDVFDQVTEAEAFVGDEAMVLVGFFLRKGIFFFEALGEKPNRGDGSAEFVGDAGDEVGLQSGELLLFAEGEVGDSGGEGGEEGGGEEDEFEARETSISFDLQILGVFEGDD